MRRYLVSCMLGMTIVLTAFSMPPYSSTMLEVSGNYLHPLTSWNASDYDDLTGHNRSLHPDNHFGGGARLIYMLNNGDLDLDYFHWNNKDEDFARNHNVNQITSGSTIFTFPFVLPAYLDPNYTNTVRAMVKFNFDRLDLAGGRFFCLSPRIGLHPFAGLRWAKLHRNAHTHFYQATAIANITTIIESQDIFFKEKNHYDGAGPLVGLDTNYAVAQNAGLIGHFYGAVLIGKSRSTLNELILQQLTIVSANDVVFDPINTAADKWQWVPAFDAKLGGYCSGCINPCSRVTLEAGWQIGYYYHIADRLQTATNIQNGFVYPLGQSFINKGHLQSNYNYSGPYVSLIFTF